MAAGVAHAQAIDSKKETVTGESFNYFDFSRAYLADPQYSHLARRALRDQPARFDFGEFRIRYMQSSWYDPIGEDVQRKMLALAEQAQDKKADDPKREEAFKSFRELVDKHLANLDVVIMAREMAKEDKRFGDEKAYGWLADGIMRDVMASGDGFSRDGAYDVITFAEETRIFVTLGLKILSTEYQRRGIREHNRHIAEDIKTGQKREVYVNVRFPMSKLRYEKKKMEENRNPLTRPR